MPAPRVIVVGGGRMYFAVLVVAKLTGLFVVSGLSAAHTIYLNGGNVLLLDKNSEHD